MNDLPAAIDRLAELPVWQRLLVNGSDMWQNRQRLERLARRCSSGSTPAENPMAAFWDMLVLQQDTDALDRTVEKVSLLTIHAAKGLEFPVVFIVGCEQGLLPLERDGMESDPEEERRLFYVAMTRAGEQLVFVRAKRRRLFGVSHETAPSPFLRDIADRLKTYEQAASRAPQRRQKVDESLQPLLFDDLY